MSVEGKEQRLLNKLEYLSLLTKNPATVSHQSYAEQVVTYASTAWPGLELKKRKLRNSDIIGCYRHRAVQVFHVKAFPRKRPETNVVIVFEPSTSEFIGHILIDLAAEHSTPRLDCPSSEYEGNPQPDEIESLLAQITPDDDNPFAIMETGEGSYIQTLCTDDGYLLEYQLVNASSHYETSTPLSFEEVVDCFVSYGFEGNQWLESFTWQRQRLE